MTATNVSFDWEKGHRLFFLDKAGLEVQLLDGTVKCFCPECCVTKKLQCIY